MKARTAAVAGVDGERLGLEIGGSYAPLVAGLPGLRVRTLDHLDQAGLVAKFAHSEVDTDRIAPVDYVWSGQRYAELVGDTRFGWILASHVVEHVPDLIGFLVQCDEILEDGGALSLIVPDKRFCFDHFRPPSGLAQVIDAHRAGATAPSVGQVAEFAMNLARLDGLDIWPRTRSGRFDFLLDLEYAKSQMAQADAGHYVDCHNWVFTPNSFRLLIHDLHALGLSPLREAALTESDDGEFYVRLSREGSDATPDRRALSELAVADLDLAAAALTAENRILREQLTATRASSSWRLTAPLRQVRRLLG